MKANIRETENGTCEIVFIRETGVEDGEFAFLVERKHLHPLHHLGLPLTIQTILPLDTVLKHLPECIVMMLRTYEIILTPENKEESEKFWLISMSQKFYPPNRWAVVASVTISEESGTITFRF